ncbi:probable galacturonosyltransferase 4 isoform X1 [Cryptomeria japonica]|uniref:probable galacturonosyltransferase 4 isoform X1 n=1 Tax=Cryptomeria japonica TaxID=3369 RepID=UPI0025AD2E1A|nr:probable galacturonosyltransferase 4 isoform X1 [Cryptomeria japonica]XP_057861823.1 probable galacturonosyltransferase 4 isoform X1 [Cryptomeria japonica]XP_057861824.1 probable galacturonosyltransferase 4 isoform X1 [Cryptomeria japonica]
MPSFRGEGHSSRNFFRCGKCHRPVVALLIFSVMAPLVFFTGRMRNFGASFGHRDFLEESSSSLNFISDSRKLNALHQEPGILLKEPIGIVYKDENDAAVSYENINKEQSLSIENAMQNERNLEQDTSEIKSGGIASTFQEKETKNATARVEDYPKLELPGITKPREISSGSSEKLSTESQNIQKVIPDFRVRQMRDQLIRARVYLNLGPIRNNAHYVRELRQRMKELQRSLGDASKDSDLPRRYIKLAVDRMKAMEQTLVKGKQLYDDCSAMVKKLRAMVHSTEELLRVHKKQNTFLTQLAAKTLPKGLHCLSMRLTTAYYALTSSEQDFPNKGKLDDKNLYHYAIFSDNILATAVVVNSTVFHAKEPEKHVFHVVTDKLNYPAIKMWFLANPPGKATIQVQTVDEFTWLNSSYSPVLRQLGSASMKEYYFRIRHSNADSNLKYRNPKYLSILNHLRFYLPEIFPNLDKVLFLDDDIVVQKDLTALWDIDMHGKVIGAVETCGESFHRFDKYLNFSNPLIAKNFDPNACGWAYGMNIFDLEKWKKQNITGIYHRWQRLNKDRQLWKLGTLPPGLITFYNLTYVLNKSWHVLGLGYNPNVGSTEIERAVVIHYNGNMKPWLEIAISKYKHHWTKYVNYDHIFLQLCNLSE